MKLHFECPVCGGNELEEIMGGCQIASDILELEEEGAVYGEQDITDGEIIRFQCRECGTALRTEEGEWISDYERLYDYAEEEGWLE